jgi:preprotein translocase subunit SecB
MSNKEPDASTEPVSTDKKTTRFDTKKIFLKDASFEAPSAPGIFTRSVTPQLSVQIDVTKNAMEEELELYEIVLKVIVTAKQDEDVLYLAECHQAGVFQVHHSNPEKQELILGVTCPYILLPFAREEINNLITKGGFSAFLLAPVNFETLMRSKKQKEIEQTRNADVTGKPN